MKSMKILSILFGLILFGSSTIAQGLNNEVVRANMLVDWERAKAYTKEYLDVMPEKGINFRPKSDMRSFSEQMLHMSQSTMTVISIATGTEAPFQDVVLEKKNEYKNKSALTKMVMDSYDYAIESIRKMDASRMDSLIKRGNYETDQFGWLNKAFEHQTHHRAQTTIYLRLKGVKVPNEKLF
jgi:uncharacterized damage-inducible protein DinB